MKIKTIDVTAKEWFDKSAGNSYFSAEIVLNYKMDDEITYEIPFTYGYGSFYEFKALELLCNENYFTSYGSLSRTCEENNIILRSNKIENCKKRDLIK
jgi:hypothetical protein